MRNLTPENREFILESLSNGLSTGEIAEKIGVSRRTIVRWAATDPEFEKEVAQSRAIYAESLVDKLMNITEGASTMTEVTARRVDSENIRWVASKFAPKTFGDNLNVNVQHHLDLSSVLLAAESRVLPLLHQSPKAIEVREIVEVDAIVATSNDIEDLL